MKTIATYAKMLRLKHYIKNLIIFLPLIFSKQLLDISLLTDAILAFFSFSFLSSFIYIMNDIKDIEKDKLHQTKRFRPIAAGRVTVKSAVITAVIMLLLSTGLNFLVYKSIFSWIILFSYLVINIAYSLKLKNIPIVDVTILAIGFLLRATYGSSITGIDLSSWFYLTMVMGSFFLGFGKRRNELIREGTQKRDVLNLYNLNFLDKNMYMCLCLTLVFYSMWTLDLSKINNNSYLIWTVPMVILIMLKYNLNIE
ncbi:MAG: UbiA prenyltransferase family protein, partial [Clostridia bacterium]|nr:UbiA prenyltransferase family protein [Clostridia bacterium]